MNCHRRKYAYTLVELIVAAGVSALITASVFAAFYAANKQIAHSSSNVRALRVADQTINLICEALTRSTDMTLHDNYITKRRVPFNLKGQKGSFVTYRSPGAKVDSAYYFDAVSGRLLFIADFSGIIDPKADVVLLAHCRELSIVKIKDPNVYLVVLDAATPLVRNKKHFRLSRIINLPNKG